MINSLRLDVSSTAEYNTNFKQRIKRFTDNYRPDLKMVNLIHIQLSGVLINHSVLTIQVP